jgi:hypothetical protein
MRLEPSAQGRGLSRRGYLKLAGAATATGLAGCEADPQTPPPGGLTEAVVRDEYGVGPADARPEEAAVGFRYFATDTGGEFVFDGERWHRQGLAAPHVTADRLAGVADRVVRTTAGLEAAFRDLSAGDTVRLASGVYRPGRWLEIDESDVTVVGESRRSTLVKPPDGANVGGFHVGPDPGDPVSNVVVAGVGVHGNEAAMDDDVKRCHAFLVEHAEGVTVRDCFATRTHPYHEHDAGGSGFTVRRHARDVSLVANETDDVGDRAIQVAGSAVRVAGNRLTNGFDRAISLDVRHPDGRKYYARDVAVVGNVGRDNSSGSVIGASQGAPRRPGAGNYAIVGNVAAGSHRRTVYLGIEEAVRNVAIVGNVGRQGDFREQRSGIYVAGDVSNLTVAGNTLADYSLHGIELEGTGSGYAVVGNTVLSPARNGLHLATDWGTVTGNMVESPGAVGIEAAVGDAVVANNAVRHAGTTGVRVGAAGSAVVAGNHVSRSGRVGPAGAAEIRVDGSDCAVVGNVVRRRAPFGIRESPGATRNSYLGNVVRTATGPAAVDGQAWESGVPTAGSPVTSPRSTARSTARRPTAPSASSSTGRTRTLRCWRSRPRHRRRGAWTGGGTRRARWSARTSRSPVPAATRSRRSSGSACGHRGDDATTGSGRPLRKSLADSINVLAVARRTIKRP